MTIKLTQEELKELLNLHDQAYHTPVIAMSVRDGLEGRDFATQAWDRVRSKWEELGRKYKFHPSQVKGIDKQTGEVFT